MPGKPIRILVADNNKDLCAALKEHIELQDDMELAGLAYDGLEALELASATLPDIIVLDITMPYLDGIGVLERLGQLDLDPRPKVIILTAFEQESMIQRLIGLGASYYMVKPFDVNTLFERIRQFSRAKDSQANVWEERHEARPRAREKTVTELELEVSKLFHEMGIPAHFRGYAYLRDAVIIAVREVEVLGNITKNLYPRIAEKYRSTTSGVESAIRHTIEIGWQRGNPDFMDRFFGYSTDNGRGRFPTSASFIAKVADKLRLESRLA
ncbi:MAG: sporulation transcription factor Spo0A [Bacteroidota bacterium]